MTRFPLSVALLVTAVVVSPIHADDRPRPSVAAELLPATTVLYVEVSQPVELVQSLLDHPIRDRLLSIDGVRRGLNEDQGLQRLEAFTRATGFSVESMLEKIAAKGVAFAVDAETRSGIGIARSADRDALVSSWEAVLFLVRANARRNGNAAAITSRTHRGVVVHELGLLDAAVVQDYLVVSRDRGLAESAIDRVLDGNGDGSLAARESFREAIEDRDADEVWAFLDMQRVRDAGLLENLGRQRRRNALVELLLGGVFDGIEHGRFVTASATFDEDGLGVRFRAPRLPDVAEPPVFLTGVADRPLSARHEVATLTMHRDLAEFWAESGALFNEETAAGFERANGLLTTLFSGLDFGDEVLGELRPGVQIVVSRNEFDDRGTAPIPAIKLPAFAAVLRTRARDADEQAALRRRFRVTFQSLIGFANVAGAQRGVTPLDVQRETISDGVLVWGEYVPGEEEAVSNSVPIHYNFSPALALVGDRVVLSSTRALAAELAVATPEPADADRDPEGDVLVEIELSPLIRVLSDNREQLVAQNMLEKGHDRSRAEIEIDTFLSLLGLAERVALHLRTDEDALRVGLDVRTRVDGE